MALQQLQHYFIAGSATPDVITTDVTWPSTFARSGWLANLNSFHPNTGAFFPGQVATGQYNGGLYAAPWFINAEGLYYRTDLIKTPPTSVSQLVSEAKQAMSQDHKLKEGLAFEGDEYEGAVTAFQSMGAQISLKNLTNIDNSANTSALNFMYDAIHTYKIAPSAVTGWEESNVQSAWLSGQTPFALNWPYIFQLSESKTGSKAAYPAVMNKTGWVPFPSATPQSSLGGDDLAINAKSTHKAAAWEFIQYLDSAGAQDTRAISAGDPPSGAAPPFGRMNPRMGRRIQRGAVTAGTDESTWICSSTRPSNCSTPTACRSASARWRPRRLRPRRSPSASAGSPSSRHR